MQSVIKTIGSLAHDFIASFQHRAVILMYHRVCEKTEDPHSLIVTPDKFAQHIEHIHKAYYPLRLSELNRNLGEGNIRKRSVVVTFDDGYVDNMLYAKPILERYEVPATIFVTTGFIGKSKPFWWDELAKLVFSTENIPRKIILHSDDEVINWEAPSNNSAQNFRMDFYWFLDKLLRNLTDQKRQEVLSEFKNVIGVKQEAKQDRVVLSKEELKNISTGIMEIGSHTVNHYELAKLPLDVQKKEIIESKNALEEIIERPVHSFSYPYGRESNVGVDAVRIAREAGYSIACSTCEEPVTRYSNQYWLPRYMVRDWAGNEFAKNIKYFFNKLV
jgi:peptidoglycan/xylan/chitin deacetylase (PgdA/CDA1 family)